MANKNMHAAKRNKNDEFYTQLTDIEKEVFEYKDQFKGKVVYLNCDDPEFYEEMKDINNRGSNFWNYFFLNFDFLGLKKLISTHYDDEKPTYKLEYEGGGVENIIKTPLKQNGDFRSLESIELLKEADIVCTNPPFSLFREYVAQLIEYGKQFIIMGNNNAITYKEIFPLIKDNKLWLGHHANKTMEFELPDYYEKWDRIDDNGVKFGKVPAISWFTNMDIKKRHEDIKLYQDYYGNENKYPKYDNYDAINVDRVKDIPRDYEGAMGVPITFLTQYNPEQFEIVALGNSRENFTPNKEYINPKKITKNGKVVSGGAVNNVLNLASKDKPKDRVYYTSENSDFLIPPYARILIKIKKQTKNNYNRR